MQGIGCAGGCGCGGKCGGGLGSLVADPEDIRGVLLHYGVILLVGAVAGAYAYAKLTRRRRR